MQFKHISDKSKGIIWSLIERFTNQGLNFIFAIVLARLLIPDDFGLIGMITIVFALSATFLDSGFVQALVRKNDADELDYNTVFYTQIGIGILLYLIIFFSAPSIASFYDQDILVDLLRFMGLTVLISSLSIIQRVVLIKRLDFKRKVYAAVPAILISNACAIYMAISGFGVWSLATNYVLMSLLSTITISYFGKWKPSVVFNYERLNSIFRFSIYLLFSGVMNVIFINIYNVLIGRYFSAYSLGLYVKSRSLSEMGSHNISGAIRQISLPILSKLRDNETELKNEFERLLKLSFMLITLVMIMIFSNSKDILYVILGNEWVGASVYLSLLAIVGIMYPISTMNMNLLIIHGNSKLFMKLEIYKKMLIVLFIIIFIRYGVTGLVVAKVITSILFVIIDLSIIQRVYNHPILTQVKSLFTYIIAACISIFSMYLIGDIVSSELPRLLMSIICGSLVYMSILIILKDEILKYIYNSVYKMIRY